MHKPRLIIKTQEPVPLGFYETLASYLKEWYDGKHRALILPPGSDPVWEPFVKPRQSHKPSLVTHRVK